VLRCSPTSAARAPKAVHVASALSLASHLQVTFSKRLALASIESRSTEKIPLSKGRASATKIAMLGFVARLLIARQHDLCQPALGPLPFKPRYRAKLGWLLCRMLAPMTAMGIGRATSA